jgi:formate dehydrogenase alpha subunit
MKKITLAIDGVEIAASEATSVLDAALQNGIYIPNLCHHPDLEPAGVCRLCMVEVEGRMGISCRIPVEEGMQVSTESEQVTLARRIALELLLVNHPLDCVTCARNNQCELQRAAAYIGVDQERMKRLRRPEQTAPVDTSNPYFEYDPNKCVLCGICVRTCDQLQGIGALDFAFRGFASAVSTFANKPIAESRCVSCGECVVRCPVGSLVPKKYRLPAREVKSICAYCGVGCGIYLGVRGNEIVNVRGDEASPVNSGSLCVKGRFGHEFVHSPDRLTHPLVRKNGKLQKAGWDEALELVARQLGKVKEEYGPNALATLASAKCSNEENYLMQKFTRAVLGTNNLDHCARLCHSSTVAGLAKSFGSGAMTNSIAEIENADVIFVIGSNTTENHPVLSLYVKRAVRERGAKLIVADPRRIPLTEFAHMHLRHGCGTDTALLNGLMHVIVREELHDQVFIEERTEGFDELEQALARYTPEFVSGVTGVSRDDLVEAARLYAAAEKATILYAMGITQHTTGTDNVLAVANLAMLTGQIGRESTGVNPLRGQNNVQGACDMGGLPNVYPGYQRVDDAAARERFEQAWGVCLSDKPGLTLVEMMHAAGEGKIRAMYFMGENPLLTDPDANHIREALENLDFLVVQDIFLTETAELADVVLPAASFAEKDGTVTNTERRVQRMHQAIEPVGEARPDWRVLCDLATRMGYETVYDSPSQILEEIASLTPSYGGIAYDRLEGDGLQWPCPDRSHAGTPYLHAGRFARGRGKFHVVEYIEPAEAVDEAYPLVLTTGRVLYHYHTVISRKAPGLNALYPEEMVEIHPADAEHLGIEAGALVRVASRRGSVVAKAEVVDRPPEGTVFMTFHFAESAANLLTNAALDPVAKIPEYKVCAVKVEAVSSEGAEA